MAIVKRNAQKSQLPGENSCANAVSSLADFSAFCCNVAPIVLPHTMRLPKNSKLPLIYLPTFQHHSTLVIKQIRRAPISLFRSHHMSKMTC